tara:strand:- start:1181 stop:1795 length:615 start_codon:yes stop_codon:yes gene_type:complete
MKLNLLATTAAAALFALPTFAADSDYDYNELSNLSGFYLGAYGGYGWNTLDTAGFEPDVDGWDYGVMVGYQADYLLDQTINRIGLGLNGAIEVHYGWSDADETASGVSLEKNDEFGISFRPGLSFLNSEELGVTPYGIIGYRNTEFEANGADEDFDGFELGIGTQLMAMGDYGVRLDYTHVWYEEQNGVDPDSDELRLGLSYHF